MKIVVFLLTPCMSHLSHFFFISRYQEYISDKNHVHMNATCWSTLNGFIDSLAQSGVVEAEMTERVVFCDLNNL